MHAKADQTSPVAARQVRARAAVLRRRRRRRRPTSSCAPPTVDPRLSTRERFAQHTADAFCATCHLLMDPIGFAFEHYDAAGRWRDIDAGKPVDATGDADRHRRRRRARRRPQPGRTQLAASAEVASCAATQWFRYAFGRSEQIAGDLCTIGELAAALKGTNGSGDFRKMVRATVRMARLPQPPAGDVTMNARRLSRANDPARRRRRGDRAALAGGDGARGARRPPPVRPSASS